MDTGVRGHKISVADIIRNDFKFVKIAITNDVVEWMKGKCFHFSLFPFYHSLLHPSFLTIIFLTYWHIYLNKFLTNQNKVPVPVEKRRAMKKKKRKFIWGYVYEVNGHYFDCLVLKFSYWVCFRSLNFRSSFFVKVRMSMFTLDFTLDLYFVG